MLPDAAILWRQPVSNEQLHAGCRRGCGAPRGLRRGPVLVMEVFTSRLLLLLLLGAWAPAPSSASSEAPPLVNEDVKRTVDLSSHLAKVTAEVVLAHPGGGSTSRATSFLLALEPEMEARLAHLGVQVSERVSTAPERLPLDPTALSVSEETWSPGRQSGRAAGRQLPRSGHVTVTWLPRGPHLCVERASLSWAAVVAPR